MDVNPTFFTLCIIAFSLSLISSMILNYLLIKKQSNYSKLMRYICLAEAIYIYGEFVIIMTLYDNSIDTFFGDFTSDLLLNMYLSLNDRFKAENLLNKLNRGLFSSNQTFSLLINNFVCLETILTLRNPISPVSKRLKAYFSLTFLCSIVVFITSVVKDPEASPSYLHSIYFDKSVM